MECMRELILGARKAGNFKFPLLTARVGEPSENGRELFLGVFFRHRRRLRVFRGFPNLGLAPSWSCLPELSWLSRLHPKPQESLHEFDHETQPQKLISGRDARRDGCEVPDHAMRSIPTGNAKLPDVLIGTPARITSIP